jgi:hypothetical protein
VVVLSPAISSRGRLNARTGLHAVPTGARRAGLFFVVLIGVLIRQLNRRVARMLQRKIDRLTVALEEQE